MPYYPFESVTMDLVTHLIPVYYSYNASYTVVDIFSKHMYFHPCKHTNSAPKLAWLFLDIVFVHHGMLALIVSDCEP